MTDKRSNKKQKEGVGELNVVEENETSKIDRLEAIIVKLADELSEMQSGISKLADCIKSNVEETRKTLSETLKKNEVDSREDRRDREYTLVWRELGDQSLTFYPKGNLHPIVFLKKLNSLFIEAGVPETAQVGLAINCLRGSALDWATHKENTFINFDKFQEFFRQRYWRPEQERDLFNEIKYGKSQTGSRGDYVLKMASRAAYLSRPYQEKELVRVLSGHFSKEIRREILLSGAKTVEELEEYLREIDETESDNRQQGGQRGNSNRENLREN